MNALAKSKMGFVPINISAGYFVMAKVTDMRKFITKEFFSKDAYCDKMDQIDYAKFEGQSEPNYDFSVSRFMGCKVKVTPMPGSAFYSDEDSEVEYIRFGICQKVETIEEAMKRLAKYEDQINH